METQTESIESLADLEAQLGALQRKYEAVKAATRARELEKVRRSIETYGFTAVEVGLAGKAPKTGTSKAEVAPKYRDPANSSNTWSGRGRQPAFIRVGLAQGKKLEDFLIK